MDSSTTADLQDQHDHLPPFVNSTIKNPPPSYWLSAVTPTTSGDDHPATTPLFTDKDMVDGSVDGSRLGSSSTTVQKQKKKKKHKRKRRRDRDEAGRSRSPRKIHNKKRRVRDILGKSPRPCGWGPPTSSALDESSDVEDDREEIAMESARKLWLEVCNEEPSPAAMMPAMQLLSNAVDATVVPSGGPVVLAPSGIMRPPIQGWVMQLEAAGGAEVDAGPALGVEAAITLPCASQMKAQYGRYMREEPPPLTPEVLWVTADGGSSSPQPGMPRAGPVRCSTVAMDLRSESLTEAQILRSRLREVVERKRELACRVKARTESFTVARRSINAPVVEKMKALVRARPPPMNVYPHNGDLKPTFGVTTSDDPEGDTSYLVCSICLEPDLARGNQMVVCSGCGVAGHQYCYEISRILDEDSWLCRLCSALENGDASESDDLSCFLCGGDRRCLGGGLMTSVMLRGSIRWIHVRCGMFAWKCRSIPDVERAAMRFSRSESTAPVCGICDKAVGETVRCGSTGCSQHFHVSCATRNALTIPDPTNHNWLIYCRQHMADVDAFGMIDKLTKTIANSPYAEQTEGGFAAAIANSAAASIVNEGYDLYRGVDAEDLWLAWMDPGVAVNDSKTPESVADRPSVLTTPATAPPTTSPRGPGVPPGCSAKVHLRCAHWMGLAPVFNFHDLRQGSICRVMAVEKNRQRRILCLGRL
ncbi:conserved hypothetical protein [Perkinsus marinus ATCC 50983]|uniref:PHD-type domain-containing protein n=1 Tax=Perkinsus marinus (strain ATCC 50983 / TXsc) TaxID=423536 RepID=C5L4G0_PERM5|nr:conserved hypothetical protein [Perkinsus marinus ATCC 50983]EER08397.1 conserved hypothetical protein [Perkinsus marinus ATCC 50983]|eukprot:XP_002776581.1 conserved hypothetical protein [Perkinsus marinus ATCC 50983]